jgi:haloacetate dehalogenase
MSIFFRLGAYDWREGLQCPALAEGACSLETNLVCLGCFTLKTIRGSCRDYRAGATCDFEMDMADRDRQIGMPFLLLFGTRGAPPSQEYPTAWRKFASNLVDAQPLPTGRYMQEEAPDQIYDHFVKFFTA